MDSSKFRKKQLMYLSSLLRCSPSEIEYICENIETYYGKWVVEKTDSAGKVKTYPDGTPKIRIIRPSLGRLKAIQRSIRINILSKVELPVYIQGGVKEKSNITNAKLHQGNKYQFATDLQEFFPTVTPKQINKLFLSLGYSQHVAYWLTKLTSCEFELPQGSPTSTAIANLVFKETDVQLMDLCARNSIIYSRFVDDLTFSSSKDFRNLTTQILDIVRSSGFKISYRKTRYAGGQTLTGIRVFNNYVDAPDRIKVKANEERKNTEPGAGKPFTVYLGRIRSTNIKKPAESTASSKN